jgi:hypothetical protein
VNRIVDPTYIIHQIFQAKTFTDTIKWCDRLIALTPVDSAFVASLQGNYPLRGDTAKAHLIAYKLRNNKLVYIARRQGKHVKLCGVIDSLNEFRTLEWKERLGENGEWIACENADSLTKHEALKAVQYLANVKWYSDRSSTLVRPKVLPTYKELSRIGVSNLYHSEEYHYNIAETLLFGISFEDSIPESHLQGNLFATKQFFFVPTSGLANKKEFDSLDWYKRKLVDTAFNTHGVTEIHFGNLKDYNYIDVTFCGNLVQHVDDGSFYRQLQRGIFNKNRQCIWPPEGYIFRKAELRSPMPDSDVDDAETIGISTNWFRFGQNATYPAFTITPFSTNYTMPNFESRNGDFGFQLIRISNTGSKIFTITSEYAGD